MRPECEAPAATPVLLVLRLLHLQDVRVHRHSHPLPAQGPARVPLPSMHPRPPADLSSNNIHWLQKPLIFLHVYHHIITLWLVWVCLDDRLSIQWYVLAGSWAEDPEEASRAGQRTRAGQRIQRRQRSGAEEPGWAEDPEEASRLGIGAGLGRGSGLTGLARDHVF